MPLTHEQRQKVITRYFPIRTVYTGKIWGGVQVVDTFMREKAEDIVLSGYDGLYSDLLTELETLTEDTPFDEMPLVSAGNEDWEL
jgi:methylmalonyl-CoA mutase cobalamin-binding subunit